MADGMKLDSELDKDSKKIIELCEIFVKARPDLYRIKSSREKTERTEDYTEEDVMNVVKKSLESQKKGFPPPPSKMMKMD